MAYGTESVPHVDKIFGPGNIFVVLAKQRVYGVVDIDQLPGPTETLLVADDSADPDLCRRRHAGPGRARPDGQRHPASPPAATLADAVLARAGGATRRPGAARRSPVSRSPPTA